MVRLPHRAGRRGPRGGIAAGRGEDGEPSPWAGVISDAAFGALRGVDPVVLLSLPAYEYSLVRKVLVEAQERHAEELRKLIDACEGAVNRGVAKAFRRK